MNLNNNILKYKSSNRKDNEKRPLLTIHIKGVNLYMTPGYPYGYDSGHTWDVPVIRKLTGLCKVLLYL